MTRIRARFRRGFDVLVVLLARYRDIRGSQETCLASCAARNRRVARRRGRRLRLSIKERTYHSPARIDEGVERVVFH